MDLVVPGGTTPHMAVDGDHVAPNVYPSQAVIPPYNVHRSVGQAPSRPFDTPAGSDEPDGAQGPQRVHRGPAGGVDH